MNRAMILACLVGFAGCGGSRESNIAGTWRIDPSTVLSTRLKPGGESHAAWTDAKAAMAQISVTFNLSPRSAEAVGWGKSSTGTWKLAGASILVKGPGDPWPTLTYDEKMARIHAVLEKSPDRLQFDLIKTP